MKKRIYALGALVILLLSAFLFLRPKDSANPDPRPRQITFGQRSELDTALLEQGVVEVRYTGAAGAKLKVQITQPDGALYNYDLNSGGNWETFPLTQGDGAYTLSLLEHKEGDRYTIRDTYPLELTLADPMAPFLRPNQIVNYANGPALTLAADLTRSQTSEAQKVATLFDYVVDHVAYDYEKSASAQPGYLPSVEDTLDSGRGICFDYDALLCAMVRSQGIPCRLVTGYTNDGELYHAWVEVYCRDSDTVDGAIPITANTWSRLDPTFVSNSNRSSKILEFVTDDENYEALYFY
ncbi:MAG: transglutaminase-like domain-containing protein [Oscillospiraceae bacterium]|nr:transglutaminase-like domain-containing protein [Oscillospiraceae bacterium]